MDCDSLLVTCSFLNWSELLTFSHTCQAYRAAAIRSTPRNVRVFVNGEVLQSVLSSSMRRHVNDLHENKGDRHVEDPCWPFTDLLSQRMPWLDKLFLHVPLYHVEDGVRKLPNALSRLIVNVDCPPIAAVAADASSPSFPAQADLNHRSTEQLLSTFVSTIAIAAPRLRSLCILVDSTIQSEAPITMLQQIKHMPNLTELKTDALILTKPEGVGVLRSLFQLRQLTSMCSFWTADQLNPLTVGQLGVDYPPLESIEPAHVDDESIDAILKLPSLIRLHPIQLDLLSDIPRLLFGLPNLTSFRAVINDENHPQKQLLQLISAFQSLRGQSKIRSLHLQHRSMTAQQVGVILGCLPQLTELTLEGSSKVLSLDFISSMPSLAASKLESFTLSRCGPLQPKEILHFGVLHRLRVLHIWSSFTATPPVRVMASMNPSNASFDVETWPVLKDVDICNLVAAPMNSFSF